MKNLFLIFASAAIVSGTANAQLIQGRLAVPGYYSEVATSTLFFSNIRSLYRASGSSTAAVGQALATSSVGSLKVKAVGDDLNSTYAMAQIVDDFAVITPTVSSGKLKFNFSINGIFSGLSGANLEVAFYSPTTANPLLGSAFGGGQQDSNGKLLGFFADYNFESPNSGFYANDLNIEYGDGSRFATFSNQFLGNYSFEIDYQSGIPIRLYVGLLCFTRFGAANCDLSRSLYLNGVSDVVDSGNSPVQVSEISSEIGINHQFNYAPPPPVQPGVPEPSTWLMLLAGFGLVGAIARRRLDVATPHR
jgi:hypothetical protein